MLYVICAGTYDEALAWAHEHGITRRRALYAGRASSVDGLRNFVTIRLPSFFGRPDWREIEATIRRSELKMAANPAARGESNPDGLAGG
ncbi:hypothetical protein [Kitasatospora sp. NPDC127116]|uniref:hypothetical protein n=1 Tax=Kitasatospora sp. NPDC127116 TaxID=3345367 RepID=UPI00363BB06B